MIDDLLASYNDIRDMLDQFEMLINILGHIHSHQHVDQVDLL
jgi:Icc-related predicted phosphoesterase